MCGYFCIGFIDFMLKGKILTEYTNLFSPNNFEKNDAIKMGDYKINEIKYYFLAEIRERELIRKNLSKYIAPLDYFDKSLNVLSILSGSISIASFATIIGVPAGIIGASCSFTFQLHQDL